MRGVGGVPFSNKGSYPQAYIRRNTRGRLCGQQAISEVGTATYLTNGHINLAIIRSATNAKSKAISSRQGSNSFW